MNKKTILITGSTDGIGKMAASRLAQDGHNIFLHGRNNEKLTSAINEIRSANVNGQVDGFLADFSNLADVAHMAQEIINRMPQVDVLINNAGVFASQAPLDTDGIDIRFKVNYLAPYQLTQALMPLLENTSHARIINLSSAAQESVSLEALEGKKQLSAQAAYAQSKLALTMWSINLAQSVKSSVIAVNPGSLLNTKMVQEAYGHFWSPAEKGSNILCDLATSETYANSTGLYFDNDRGSFAPAHADAYDQDKVDALFRVTHSIVNK